MQSKNSANSKSEDEVALRAEVKLPRFAGVLSPPLLFPLYCAAIAKNGVLKRIMGWDQGNIFLRIVRPLGKGFKLILGHLLDRGNTIECMKCEAIKHERQDSLTD